MTTFDQEQAINNLKANIVVSAGAGAGKTYVLVKRFVNVLLRSDKPGRLNAVVAITFTRAAAMEMRERIRNELERRYRGEREREDEEITSEDRHLSGLLLAQMDSARIDTIHALCATIVRANAAEAQIDPRFEVQDATQQMLRLSALIRSTLQATTHNDAIGFLVSQYGLDVVEQQLTACFSAPLPKYPPRVEDLVSRWQQNPEYASLPEPDLQHLARLTVAWDQVIRHMQAVYAAEKQSLNVLDFDDLEKKTVELLNTYPHIRARYQGSEFQQLLVDEFQDTNGAQWDIVRALGDLHNPGTLFIVGDVKQSIYGFRRADVRVFSDVKAQIEAHQGVALKLAMSFRSTPSLISLFNALFKKLLVSQPNSQAQAYQVVFDHAMEVHRQDRSTMPSMRLLLLRKKPAEITASGFRGIKAELRRMWEGEEIARHIRSLEGLPILDRETKTTRSFKYGDVAILMRSLNGASHYEDALQRAGIPYVTFSGKGFYGLQEIYDLQNMLRVLQNTQDSLALAAVLRSPMFGLSDETLFSLRQIKWIEDELLANQPPPVLWDQLMWIADGTLTLFLSEDEKSRIDRAANVILGLQAYAGRASSAELMRAIFTQTGYLATVSSLPQGAQRRRNLEKLLDTAQALPNMSPAAFTHHLTELAKSSGEIREGEAAMEANDVVKIMSVHASKGLEFPVVFLADASPFRESKNLGDVYVAWDERGEGQLLCRPKNSSMSQKPKADEVPPPPDFMSYQSFLQEKDAAEELRLLYVAATRARDMFYISGEVTEDKKGDLSAKGWLGAMLRTLDIKTARDQQTILWENEAIQIFLPRYPAHLPDPTAKEVETPDKAVDPAAERLLATWEDLTSAASQTHPVAPALLPAVMIEPRKFAEHLTATQLAAFGASLTAAHLPEQRHYRQSARRTVLYDIPGVVRAAVRPYDPRVTQRIIGDIVHEALRFERYPSTTPNLDKILESYAWNKGLTQQHDLEDAIKRARHLLRRFEQSSDVYAWIQEVKQARMPLYRELPFLCRSIDGRILHGMIDIVFQRPSGTWVIIDYKTGYVPPTGEPDFTSHSERYYLQVGAYADAVANYVGSIPDVYIHYLRYCKTEPIPTIEWQNAIGQLESTVIDVMGTGL